MNGGNGEEMVVEELHGQMKRAGGKGRIFYDLGVCKGRSVVVLGKRWWRKKWVDGGCEVDE